MDLKDTIRTIPDFPKEGILFRDVTTLFKDPAAYRQLIDGIVESLGGKQVDLVVGPEARGFVLGSALAYALGAGFVLARKPGKLPCDTIRHEYALEYGTDALEIHTDSIQPGSGYWSWTTFWLPAVRPCHHTLGGTGGGTGGSRPICHRAFRPGWPNTAAGLRRGRSGQLLTGIGGEISGHYRWSLPLYL